MKYMVFICFKVKVIIEYESRCTDIGTCPSAPADKKYTI